MLTSYEQSYEQEKGTTYNNKQFESNTKSN